MNDEDIAHAGNHDAYHVPKLILSEEWRYMISLQDHIDREVEIAMADFRSVRSADEMIGRASVQLPLIQLLILVAEGFVEVLDPVAAPDMRCATTTDPDPLVTNRPSVDPAEACSEPIVSDEIDVAECSVERLPPKAA